ncbi:lytic transglycosylase domain-containing protein, partial [Rhodosalinus sp.]|uniref:lytic transglycosylase domain-containing protein n=1 Tax=Rhodosalinus sp. TaxID=2047741 RepID=UPI0035680A24
RYAWFWDAVSPDAAAAAGPGRIAPALASLDAGDIAAPRLQALQDLARGHGATILQSTAGTRVSPALVLAVIAIESGGDAAAVSRAGAEGLMQLMPDTAARFGVADSFDAAGNIRGGVAYLDWLMDRFEGDPILALAGYNAGEGAVRDHAGVPPFAETRAYVPKVLAAYSVARGLCRTPPELITDGCVFVTGDA